MAVDYEAKERAFIESLKPDTGRDLAEWMAAIDAAGLGHRNDIIDWLRQQGFLFAKASWIERIHHNGGRPIYGEAAASRLNAVIRRMALGTEAAVPVAVPTRHVLLDPPVPRISGTPLPSAAPARPLSPPPAAVPMAPTTATQPASFASGPEVEEVLARGKAYRPLAQLVLREIAKNCPGLSATVRDDYVVLAAAAEFAVMTVSPKEIRLGLDLGSQPFAAPLQKARLSGPPPRFTHMVVLTDARQVDEALLSHVRAARARTGAPG
jgi:hypothetical protein